MRKNACVARKPQKGPWPGPGRPPGAAERAALRRHYAPPIAIDPGGAHWHRTWLMLRDSLVYWPWYNRRRAGLRRVAADFGAERLHAWTFEVMKQHHACQHVIEAALQRDAAVRPDAASWPADASTPSAADSLHRAVAACGRHVPA
jgi:hypothetical protein